MVVAPPSISIQQVLEISKRALRKEDPDTLTSMANLSWTSENREGWEKVEQLEMQVMETSKRKLGEDHPYSVISKNILSSGQHGSSTRSNLQGSVGLKT